MSGLVIHRRIHLFSVVLALLLLFAESTATEREEDDAGKFYMGFPRPLNIGSSVTRLISAHRRTEQPIKAPSGQPLLRMYMTATSDTPGSRQASDPALRSSHLHPLSKQHSTDRQRNNGDAASWRWCYICSGKYPDRECELHPERVSRGPSKTNCTKGFCTAYVRYKPKTHLLVEDEDKKLVAARPLKPDDFDVTSIARECESIGRGNTCLIDGDQLGITCYSSCSTDYCNDDTRRPEWQHFRQRRPDEQPGNERHGDAGAESMNSRQRGYGAEDGLRDVVRESSGRDGSDGSVGVSGQFKAEFQNSDDRFDERPDEVGVRSIEQTLGSLHRGLGRPRLPSSGQPPVGLEPDTRFAPTRNEDSKNDATQFTNITLTFPDSGEVGQISETASSKLGRNTTVSSGATCPASSAGFRPALIAVSFALFNAVQIYHR